MEIIQMSINNRIGKYIVVYFHKRILYSNENEELLHAAADRNLVNIILSERNQTHAQNTMCISVFYVVVTNYHTFSGFKKTQIYYLWFYNLEVH